MEVDACEGAGWTPLILSAWWNRTACLKELLRLGAAVDAVDKNGWSAYHHGCARSPPANARATLSWAVCGVCFSPAYTHAAEACFYVLKLVWV